MRRCCTISLLLGSRDYAGDGMADRTAHTLGEGAGAAALAAAYRMREEIRGKKWALCAPAATLLWSS